MLMFVCVFVYFNNYTVKNNNIHIFKIKIVINNKNNSYFQHTIMNVAIFFKI